MLLLLVLALPALAQWQADQRLTNNTAVSLMTNNNAWGVAANGNTVHVVWYDNRDGNYEIYYKRSTDAGATWGSDTRLTNNTGISYYPAVAVRGDTVHVVWQDTFLSEVVYEQARFGFEQAQVATCGRILQVG